MNLHGHPNSTDDRKVAKQRQKGGRKLALGPAGVGGVGLWLHPRREENPGVNDERTLPRDGHVGRLRESGRGSSTK